ncbi:hypothetical protein Slin15195_G119190 [Septoria linicola]|uniref:Uncharacterized protein n=1 Tax=Septoria linicola TaxID=215465 RepID=A0A9Q9B5H4_9PEZI|nr:hypothetical protein Slin15195_G119190 [Septoria linicola]
MHISTLLPAFAALALANKAPAYKSQYTVANYDDITVVPAVPAANNLGTYKGLKYTAFATNQALDVTGVATKSPMNNIVSGVQQTALAGAEAGFAIAGDSKYFDLKSLYYGCSVNTAEGAAGLPQACTINVRGYRKTTDTNPVASKQLTFTPKLTQVLAQPVKATFGRSFTGLQKVEIVQIESTSGEALNVIVLDDVAYNLYTPAAKAPKAPKGYGY